MTMTVGPNVKPAALSATADLSNVTYSFLYLLSYLLISCLGQIEAGIAVPCFKDTGSRKSTYTGK